MNSNNIKKPKKIENPFKELTGALKNGAEASINKLETDILMNMNDEDYNSESETPVVNFKQELIKADDKQCLDIVYLVESTPYIKKYLPGIKRYIRKLTWDALKACQTNVKFVSPQVKFGLVSYRQHPPVEMEYISKVITDLDDDHLNFRKNLKEGLNIKKEEDDEFSYSAVLNGMNDAINKISWRDESYKMIFHFLITPDYEHCENLEDGDEREPEFDYEDVLAEFREKDIDYTIVKFGNSANFMLNDFYAKYYFDLREHCIDELKK